MFITWACSRVIFESIWTLGLSLMVFSARDAYWRIDFCKQESQEKNRFRAMVVPLIFLVFEKWKNRQTIRIKNPLKNNSLPFRKQTKTAVRALSATSRLTVGRQRQVKVPEPLGLQKMGLQTVDRSNEVLGASGGLTAPGSSTWQSWSPWEIEM